ncbi:MAG: hypothetical protein GTO51_05100 [Candidatus Latescibacteria bacterium]|nr:hypothetical protein [Candidatus Latescibacterota bacterium]NIO28379.1 hypothetical protein [Candidatus Latescibacterota bacterium]NIO55928.1 hypothetical protein [Candidatus Latescibacterota bacterium]NIT01892.1 hypothetical protein [Candidatus Latescibacterota bacterium]
MGRFAKLPDRGPSGSFDDGEKTLPGAFVTMTGDAFLLAFGQRKGKLA